MYVVRSAEEIFPLHTMIDCNRTDSKIAGANTPNARNKSKLRMSGSQYFPLKQTSKRNQDANGKSRSGIANKNQFCHSSIGFPQRCEVTTLFKYAMGRAYFGPIQ